MLDAEIGFNRLGICRNPIRYRRPANCQYVTNVSTDTIHFLSRIELHVHYAFIVIVLSAPFNAQLRVRVRVERDRHGPAGSIEYGRRCAAAFKTQNNLRTTNLINAINRTNELLRSDTAHVPRTNACARSRVWWTGQANPLKIRTLDGPQLSPLTRKTDTSKLGHREGQTLVSCTMIVSFGLSRRVRDDVKRNVRSNSE